MNSTFSLLLNLLFPPRCLSCGKLGSYLCFSCMTLLFNRPEPICPVCKRTSVDGATHPKCKTKYTLDGLVVFWKYNQTAHKVIHKIKYTPFVYSAIEEMINKTIFQGFFEIMQRKINKSPDLNINYSFRHFLSQKPLLVPVPLYKSRKKYRGYNQAEKIAQVFAKQWNLEVKENLLIRTKKTQTQAKLNFIQRQQNIKNAFAINFTAKQTIYNPAIILIDDVWTTGSTLSECCKILKQSGKFSVWALALAR